MIGLDVKQSPTAQDTFRPIPGLISCAGVTGSVGITCHARATQMAGLTCISSLSDFFRGQELSRLALDGVDHIISFTATEGKIYLRVYQ